MNLLTAINSMLPYVGQRTVSTVTSNHPSVATAKGMLEDKRRELLNKAWWFNQRTVTLYPDVSNRIAKPIDTVAVYPISADLIEARGGFLFNLTQNTDQFTAPLQCTLRDDLAFDDLPATAQEVITWNAAVNMYLAKFEGGAVPTRLDRDSIYAQAALEAEHLRKQNYNSHNLPAVQRITRILRG